MDDSSLVSRPSSLTARALPSNRAPHGGPRGTPSGRACLRPGTRLWSLRTTWLFGLGNLKRLEVRQLRPET